MTAIELMDMTTLAYDDKKFKKKVIYIDLDGVTWKVHKLLLDLYNKRYGTNYKVEDINRWDFLPKDRFYAIYKILTTYIGGFEPMDSNIKTYINTLHTFFDVYFLSHGGYRKEDVIFKLSTWGLYKGSSYEDVIIEEPINCKVHYEGNYFIDDNPNMVNDIQLYLDKTLLLYTSPWNTYINEKEYENVIRVNNWKEIMNYFFGEEYINL